MCILACFFFKTTVAQSVIIQGQLYGDPVNTTGEVYSMVDGAGFALHTQYAVTSSGLYIFNYNEEPHTLPMFEMYDQGFFAKAFTPPAGTSIKDVKIKKYNGTFDRMLILLTDGSIYRLDPYNYPWNVAPFGNIQDSISQSFFKIGGDDVYVLSSSHFYVTRDSGSTWQVDDAGVQGSIYDFATDTGQNIFLVSANGLYKQTPHGSTWNLLSSTYAGNHIFIDSRNRILISGYFNSALYLSPDGGTNWSMDTSGLNQYWIKNMAGDVFGNLYAVAYNISTYPAHDMLFRSLGGTQPWQQIDSSLNNLIQSPFSITAISGDTLLSIGTDFGYFFSADSGRTWGMNNRGIQAGTLASLVKQNNDRLVTSSPLGAYVIDVNDSAWHKTFPAPGYDASVLIYGDSSTGTLYLQDRGNPSPFMQSPQLYKSTDNGNTWVYDTAGLYPVKASNLYVDETGVMYLTSSSYGSTQHAAIYFKNGSSWVLDSAGIPWVSYSYINDFCSDHRGYLYAAVSVSNNNYMMMRRAKSGTQWLPDTAGIPAGTYILKLTSSAAAGVLAATGNQIYHRTGNGTWVQLQLPPQLSSPGIVAFSADVNGTVFVSFTDASHSWGAGVYYTKDMGNTWVLAGLVNTYINTLVSYADTTYGLSYQRWGYILTENTVSSIAATGNANEADGLKLFPNPVDGSFTVTGDAVLIPNAVLKVYDATGREVYSTRPWGGQLNIETGKWARGVYVLEVYGAQQVISKKIIKQ